MGPYPSLARELGGPAMDTHAHPNAEAGSADSTVSEVHNASVDEDAARQGGCAQVHLPTGRMCTLQHGHLKSCDFSAASQAPAVLGRRKAAERW